MSDRPNVDALRSLVTAWWSRPQAVDLPEWLASQGVLVPSIITEDDAIVPMLRSCAIAYQGETHEAGSAGAIRILLECFAANREIRFGNLRFEDDFASHKLWPPVPGAS